MRVLGTVEGMKRFVEIKAEPVSRAQPVPGNDRRDAAGSCAEIHDVIRYFGARGKIFNIHFRNIRGQRDDFQEVFPDEGDMDMLAVCGR